MVSTTFKMALLVVVAAVGYTNLNKTEQGQQMIAKAKETVLDAYRSVQGMYSNMVTAQCGLFPYTDYALISNRVVLPGHGVVPAASESPLAPSEVAPTL
jgi:hypothetical protein